MRTVVGVFPEKANAERVANDLNALGIPTDDITIVGPGAGDHEAEWTRRNLAAAAGCGWGWLIAALIPAVAEANRPAAIGFGALLGGGVVTALTTLAIRTATQVSTGEGIVISITALVAGAAAGGIAAGIYNAGVSREKIPLHEEAIRERGIVVAAHVDEPMENEAVRLFEEHGARNLRAEADAWLASGWKGAYDKAALYPSDSTIRTHGIG